MFPADFAYVRARSLDEALDLLAEARAAGEEAKLIAGGQSLLPMMKLRLAAPQLLIDIADLRELGGGGWHGAGDGTAAGADPGYAIGALTTYRELGRSRLVNGAPAGGIPAITDALAVLADPQVRARGTIGGAVAHGDPAADLPAVLLALNAELTIVSRNPSAVGRRVIALDDFLQGIYATDLAEDEIITRVSIRTRGARASAYEKFPHPASHLPLAGVCAVVRLRDGRIEGAQVAVTGTSPRPYRAREAEALLAGALPSPATLAAAAARVTAVPPATSAAPATRAAPGATAAGNGRVTLLGDQHASAGYRAHLAEVLTRRALARAVARADASAR
jgi:carbon-monoxide dehydrogenase medium subunit